jgi:hypothetical protein
MAILDTPLKFYSANKAVTTTGVSDVLNMGAISNWGDGNPMYAVVMLLTAFTGTTTDRTLTLTMESTSTGTPAAGNTVMQLLPATKQQAIDAAANEGVLACMAVPSNLMRKYTSVRHTASAALTGGYINVFLSPVPIHSEVQAR